MFVHITGRTSQYGKISFFIAKIISTRNKAPEHNKNEMALQNFVSKNIRKFKTFGFQKIIFFIPNPFLYFCCSPLTTIHINFKIKITFHREYL